MRIDRIDGGLIAISVGILTLGLLPMVWGVMAVASIVFAFIVFGVVRTMNHRDDGRYDDVPPDAP